MMSFSLKITNEEVANIKLKFSCWKLMRNKDWNPNLVKYSLPLKNFNNMELFFKVITILDPNMKYDPAIVAEAAEFCDYWVDVIGLST